MTDQPKNQPTFHINTVGNLNTGDVTIQGDQIGIQHSYTEQNVEVVLTDFKQFLNNLQQKYPNATDETAMQVIDSEFTTMKRSQPQRWQNFLNLKRQWNGIRTALLKAGEHYTEETPWGKALIGYFEGVSEDLE